jgi:hypothetical protein
MFKKICLISLFFVFIGCNQLLSKDGIKTAVAAGHAGHDANITENETTTTIKTTTITTTGHSSAVNGKVIEVEVLADMSAVATIKGPNGELHRCKMLEK